MPDKLLIVGSDRTESLESSYARAFRHLGWETQFWNPAAAINTVVRGGRLGRLLAPFVHIEPWWLKANTKLLTVADQFAPNLVLVVATSGVRAGTLAQLRVRHPKIRLVCVFPDSPHMLYADRIHCLAQFDQVYVSSPAWVESFRRLGAQQVAYLPFAADTELHRPATPSTGNANLAHDLTFIGTWRAEREAFLSQLADYDLVVWGSSYWRRRTRPHSPLRRKWGGRSLVGAEFAQACAQSKILLNVTDPVSWPGPNMRTFELPACGAFALTERTEPVLSIFREGETIECFADAAEARAKIDYYLAHDADRERIAKAAYDFVVQTGHTYHDRVRAILSQ